MKLLGLLIENLVKLQFCRKEGYILVIDLIFRLSWVEKKDI